MKRRDFLKGILGTIAGIGAGATLAKEDTPSTSEIIELPELEQPISTMRVFGEKNAIGTYADGTTREIISGERLQAGDAVYMGEDGKYYRSGDGHYVGIALDEKTLLVSKL